MVQKYILKEMSLIIRVHIKSTTAWVRFYCKKWEKQELLLKQERDSTCSYCSSLCFICYHVIYMGEKDIERQSPNVLEWSTWSWNKSVSTGSKSLKDAMNEALRDWVTNVKDTFYIIGTAAGPHPQQWLETFNQ